MTLSRTTTKLKKMKRNILYELRWQLRHGTKQTQIQWCNDPVVINWSQKFYQLWNKTIKEYYATTGAQTRRVPIVRQNSTSKQVRVSSKHKYFSTKSPYLFRCGYAGMANEISVPRYLFSDRG